MDILGKSAKSLRKKSSPDVIEPEEYHPDFPGEMNYLDWLMSLKPDKFLASPVLTDQLILVLRRQREVLDSGGRAPKKNVKPKLTLERLGLAKIPTIKLRRLT